MIFSSNVNYGYVNEAELDRILENAEDRFPHQTIAEAGAIIVAEQERNWTAFMKGVGFSEFHTIREGRKVVYESGRLESFFEKAVAYFKMALSKLAQLTKTIIAKVMQLVAPNKAFLDKYKSQLKSSAKVEDFKGYQFNDTLLEKTPSYDWSKHKAADITDTMTPSLAESVIADSDSDEMEKRVEAAFGVKESDGDSFGERLQVLMFGDTTKDTFDFEVGPQMKILKETSKLKDKAKSSYKTAASKLKTIISKFEKAENKAANDSSKKEEDRQYTPEEYNKIAQAYNYLTQEYKLYAGNALMYHTYFMRALTTRNRQAKAICTKAITKQIKKDEQRKRNDYRGSAGISRKDYSESYYDAEAFLGAVEFI